MSEQEKRAEIDRVLHSAILQNAPMLQKLLEFIATHSGEAIEPTEYTVATEVFGRGQGFDPSADTTVRTAVYRLRVKLREYYAAEGKADEVILQIPKGHYMLVGTRREPAVSEAPAPETELALPAAPAPRRSGALVRVLLLALAFGVGIAVGPKLTDQVAERLRPAASGEATRPSSLLSLWRGFAGPGHAILVTFANVEMLHDDAGDLLRFEGGATDDRGARVEPSIARNSVATPGLVAKQPLFYEDGYSGTGEVQSMYHLTRQMTLAGIDMQTKRSRLVSSDDFKNHSVVLLGAGRENIAVNELRLRQGYIFETPKAGMWSNSIRDTKPLPGGRSVYAVERDPKSQALKTDYALFSVMPGLANGKIMVLAGLTTSGTLGAAEFATSESQIAALVSKMGVKSLPPYFESILEVRVVRGLDPISVRCVAARPIEE